MVFQSYALYPHMTVFDNIAFPLRMIATPRDEVERAVRDAAREVHIDHLLARTPGPALRRPAAALRAGARDRAQAALFLLDEPLSNLDAKLRSRRASSCASCSARSASPRST
jgi:multiple sugar transport system ATP-binding protein